MAAVLRETQENLLQGHTESLSSNLQRLGRDEFSAQFGILVMPIFPAFPSVYVEHRRPERLR